MASKIYRLASLANLTFGHHTPHTPFTYAPQTTTWNPPIGALTPREIITSTTPLLSSVIFRINNNAPTLADLESLISGLSNLLSTTTRESSLPLPTAPLGNSRKELYAQADLIGTTLTRYVRESTQPTTDPQIRIRSPCEGHLWSAPVVALLLGPTGGSDVMTLYNEWVHQIILLRDALLPYENFEDVRLVLTAESRGMRGFEKPRKLFLADMMGGEVPQRALVEMAMSMTARSLSTRAKEGYGWQYAYGTVLPASLGIGQGSLRLLRYHPTRIDTSAEELLFEYEHPAYFEVPRSDVGESEQSLQKGTWPPPTTPNPDYEASIVITPGSSGDSRVLSLQLSFPGDPLRVDLGQIARGRRFAYLPQGTTSAVTGLSATAAVHKPLDILRQSGLVTAGAGIHVVPVSSPLVELALLGKIYPENVVLVSKEKGDHPAMAEKVGKGYGARFILWEVFE